VVAVRKNEQNLEVKRAARRESPLAHTDRKANIPRRFLGILLALFLVKGILITFVFTPYSGHDEVMHYAYLQVLAEEGRVPRIPDLDAWRAGFRDSSVEQPSFDHAPEELFRYADKPADRMMSFTTADWYGDYPTTVWAVTYDGDYFPSGWIYTANHPPLFYMLMTPIYWLVDGLDIDQQIYFFRLATIPMGMLTVVFAYLTVRTIFPRDRFLAMTVPAFVAFQPQISYESAMLNNDILAIMFTSAVIWMLAVGLRRRFPIWNCLLMGLFLGLAILSKSTSVTTAALIAIAMIFGLHWKDWPMWMPKGALVAGVAALISAPWIVYMMSTYGDPTALNRVSELQWWNYSDGQGRSIWSMLSDKWFFWDRWRETWGGFGWRVILLDWNSPVLLSSLLGITLFGTLGLAVYALRFLRTQRWMIRQEEEGRDPGEIRLHTDETLSIGHWQVTAVLTMGVACVLGYYSILQFGTTFALTQARYYFPMIVPGAILLMLGLRSWFPRPWLRYVGAAIFLGLVVLNLLIHAEHVIPFWNPGL
jgi:4-amino-4-deoxy-L-arabinose transferase-like glycosyltransferase